jgi:hypothetical protein
MVLTATKFSRREYTTTVLASGVSLAARLMLQLMLVQLESTFQVLMDLSFDFLF